MYFRYKEMERFFKNLRSDTYKGTTKLCDIVEVVDNMAAISLKLLPLLPQVLPFTPELDFYGRKCIQNLRIFIFLAYLIKIIF